MRIVLLTPGTGTFYCGSCLRDGSLARALTALGHDVELVPLYLPFVLEDHGVEEQAPVHLGGINMFLQHKLPLLRWAPGWLSSRLDSPALLRWASKRSDMVGASQLGELTLSTLRGEEGRQAGEIAKLVRWLASRPPADVVCLSNVMLIGIARLLKRELKVPVVCSLQGEAPFLDALSEPYRTRAWSAVAERAGEVDLFVPVSHDYGARMRERLGLDPGRLRVVHNGIPLDGLGEPAGTPAVPTIGYLARMCADKGLATLVDAFLILKRRASVGGLRLRAAGAVLPADQPLLAALAARIEQAGFSGQAEFLPNVERPEKLRFLRSLSVLSVPATYGESFGLYLLEAMACGVPVVQPRHAAFPEILEATGGGILVEPDDPESLADGIERVLSDPDQARALGERGRRSVHERFGVERMAEEFAGVCMMAASGKGAWRTSSR